MSEINAFTHTDENSRGETSVMALMVFADLPNMASTAYHSLGPTREPTIHGVVKRQQM